jgi:hypothetical protein
MRRFLRYLRIGFCATCGIACVLLIVLWVRSYYVSDAAFMRISQSTGYNSSSMQGQLTLRRETIDGSGFYGNMGILDWVWTAHPPGAFLRYPTKFGFDLRQVPYFIVFPYWALVFVSVVLAAMPVLNWRRLTRFSLRTLLIGTMLVAVGLGMLAWLMRASS